MQDADRQGVGGGHDRRRRAIESQQCAERLLASGRRVGDLTDVAIVQPAEALAHVPLECGAPLADVAKGTAAHEGDSFMAKPGEVIQPGPDAQAVVDVHRRDIKRARALPECDHRNDQILQVFEQPRLVLHVAQQDDRVAMAGLEDHGQRDRLVGASMGVTEHDVVAVGHRLDRERLDRTREERVRDVADDGTEQHRGGAAQPAGERVRPISELASGKDHPFPGRLRDRDAGRCVVQDARDRALRDLGHRGDVTHARHAAGWYAAPRGPGLRGRAAVIGCHGRSVAAGAAAMRSVGPPGCRGARLSTIAFSRMPRNRFMTSFSPRPKVSWSWRYSA